uniref:Endoplasmic reticulum oxidoreductin 1 n=1 Tax=Craspedostauros australis TaxID=1486917 RepID=A0A7R9WLB7_9STRA|mmetsp:Transcript_10532/g.29033  ORF Transcript_10532/g.29033 Transcript_10532/m.29033 type:complete len:258 (+) Transcript_10532:161-934(+)
MPSNDYYDTEEFPEDYTGYDGAEVWKFIHNRLCFSEYGYDDDHWKADFNKAVSGLHSVISAQVVRGIRDKADRGEAFDADEVWTDAELEYQRRLSPSGETPKASENLFFAYMLALTAATKAKDRLLEDCDNARIDAEVVGDIQLLLSHPIFSDASIGVAAEKLHADAMKDLESDNALWEARMRTRELLRIMNCVQCNKCRLHGKISMMGLSTVFQILMGRSGEGGDPNRVHRVELATLISTLYKFSRAVDLCSQMKK